MSNGIGTMRDISSPADGLLQKLPRDLLVLITSHLQLGNLLVLRATSRQMRDFVRTWVPFPYVPNCDLYRAYHHLFADPEHWNRCNLYQYQQDHPNCEIKTLSIRRSDHLLEVWKNRSAALRTRVDQSMGASCPLGSNNPQVLKTRTIDIIMPHEIISAQGSPPALVETLTLRSFVDVARSPELHRILSNLPNLRHLHLPQYYANFPFAAMLEKHPSMSERLETLTIGEVLCMDAFRYLTRLKSLTIMKPSPDQKMDPKLLPVSLEYLSCDITGVFSDFVLHAPRHLTRLQRLQTVIRDGTPVVPHEHINALCTNILVERTFVPEWLTQIDVWRASQFRQPVPQLERLEIDFKSLGLPKAELCVALNKFSQLPRLQTLVLRQFMEMDISDGGFSAGLWSRLTKLSLIISSFLPCETIWRERLPHLRKLKLTFFHSEGNRQMHKTVAYALKHRLPSLHHVSLSIRANDLDAILALLDVHATRPPPESDTEVDTPRSRRSEVSFVTHILRHMPLGVRARIHIREIEEEHNLDALYSSIIRGRVERLGWRCSRLSTTNLFSNQGFEPHKWRFCK